MRYFLIFLVTVGLIFGCGKLQSDPEYIGPPVFTFDGSHIMSSVSWGRLKKGVYLIDKETGSLKEVPIDFRRRNVYPSQSPDGSRIAFNKETAKSSICHIATMNNDGSGLVYLTGGNINDNYPVYSRDGKTIYFYREDPPMGRVNRFAKTTVISCKLCSVSSDRTRFRELWDVGSYAPQLGRASISSDGKYLIRNSFELSKEQPNMRAIALISLDGSNDIRYIWPDIQDDFQQDPKVIADSIILNGAFFPDSRYLLIDAYAKQRTDAGRWLNDRPHIFYKYDLVTNALEKIIDFKDIEFKDGIHKVKWIHISDVSFSPDGSEMAFGEGYSGGSKRLFIMNSDGSGLRQIKIDNPYM